MVNFQIAAKFGGQRVRGQMKRQLQQKGQKGEYNDTVNNKPISLQNTTNSSEVDEANGYPMSSLCAQQIHLRCSSYWVPEGGHPTLQCVVIASNCLPVAN